MVDTALDGCGEGLSRGAGTHAPFEPGCPTGWSPLRWNERSAVLIGVLVIVAVTVPHLPPGICYGDSGDLQAASATLGIAHPPGYAGYATLGYLITRLPAVDPAYMVSLGCLGAGVIGLWLAMMMQVRLGVNAWVAAAIGVALTAQRWVWVNLLAPEVYAPSLALLAGSAYLLLKHSHTGRRRDLLLSALLFGFAAANRPPAAFALPFFVIAWWTGRKAEGRQLPNCGRAVVAHRPPSQGGLQGGRTADCTLPLPPPVQGGGFARPAQGTPGSISCMGTAAAVVTCLALPMVYQLSYFWLRDTPANMYNYIEQYNVENRILPPSTASPSAKFERVVWQAGAVQFRHLMGNDWRGVRTRLRWLRHELAPERTAPLVSGAALLGLGAFVAARRNRPGAWLLGGMAAQSVTFYCAYRINGQAADLLPVIWAGAVTAGVGLSPLLGRDAARVRRLTAAAALGITCTWTVIDAANRPHVGQGEDATDFVAEVDLATLPRNAVICSSWGTSPPLWYARDVLTGRRDVTILNASAGRWMSMIAPYPGREVYCTEDAAPVPDGYELRPFRSLWQLVPADDSAQDQAEDQAKDQ